MERYATMKEIALQKMGGYATVREIALQAYDNKNRPSVCYCQNKLLYLCRIYNKKEMERNIKPQFSFEMLYVPPFTKQRGFDPNTLTTIWEPYRFERKKSGVELLDAVVDTLIAGRNPHHLAWQWGIQPTQLNALTALLTGLALQDFVVKWKLQTARLLLLHTTMPLSEVMQRIGYTSQTSFSRFIKQNLGLSPIYFRLTQRKNGDLNKYAV